MITTEGKTIEEVLTEIAAKLVAQGKPCVGDNGNCVHGDSEGNHCAIGLLLPEDNAALMNFGGNVERLIKSGVDMGPNRYFIEMNSYRFSQVQKVHDDKTTGRLSEVEPWITTIFKEWNELEITQ